MIISQSRYIRCLSEFSFVIFFRVHFIDAVKVLDLKVMQQIFKKELTEFERGDIAVVSVMKNIQKSQDIDDDYNES